MPNSHTKQVAALAASAAMISAAWSYRSGQDTLSSDLEKLQAPAPTATSLIYEDDPRWDCRTMDNRMCGSINPNIILKYNHRGELWWPCWAADDPCDEEG